MLKAIHASEHMAVAPEKAFQVIDKLRASRLTKAAEAAAHRWRTWSIPEHRALEDQRMRDDITA